MGAGLLYARTDLLERHGFDLPETWRELEETAAAIQRAERAAGRETWGYVFQGRAYEGLTCNALEWLWSHGGGLVDRAGALSVLHGPNVETLRRAAGWVGTIAPPGVLHDDEEQARGVFQSGRAVFIRNWPNAFALGQSEASPVRGKVRVAPPPRGEGPGAGTAACLGGLQLAVSVHSDVAVDLIRHLTGPAEQKRRALLGGIDPTIGTLYDDPETGRVRPWFAALRPIFQGARSRPASSLGIDYPRLSHRFYSAAHAVLRGDLEADAALAGLARQLQRSEGRSRASE